MRTIVFLGTVVATCLFTPTSATTQVLTAGKFVATTLGNGGITTQTSSVQLIDPFIGKSQPLSIKNFPGTGEGPDAVWIEGPTSMVLGTRGGTAATQPGNVYRAQFGSSGWVATKLNTTVSGVSSVAALVVIGGTIYFPGATTSGGTTGTSAVLMSMPAKGGKVSLYVDVGKAGSTGLGNALTAVGTTLHYFTFDSSASTTANSQHWTVDTTATTPKAVKVADMPDSKRISGAHFGVVQADYDPINKLLVIAGVHRDVLWRTPAGKDIRHITTGSATVTDFLDGLALNTDTGAVGIGDRTGHYEELRCDGAVFMDDFITMPAPITNTTRLSNMAYVSGKAKYLSTGPGCKQASGKTPCNYVSNLPAKGNKVIFTLQAVTKRAILVVGVKKNATPFDMGVMGAPGCFLYQTLDFLIPATKLTATGAEVGPIKIPTTAPNSTVFTQWLLTDSVNPMGVVVSDGRRLDVR